MYEKDGMHLEDVLMHVIRVKFIRPSVRKYETENYYELGVIVSNEPTQWWAAMDCACALENIFLAAKSLGIGSCWINQLGQTMSRKLSRMMIFS